MQVSIFSEACIACRLRSIQLHLQHVQAHKVGVGSGVGLHGGRAQAAHHFGRCVAQLPPHCLHVPAAADRRSPCPRLAGLAASLPTQHMPCRLLCLLSMQMHPKIHPALSATPAARCSMSDIWATCIKAKCTFCAALTAAPPAAPPTGPGHQAHAPCRASAPGRSPAAPTAPAATLPLRRRLPNGAWQHLHAESSSLTPRCTVSVTCYTMADLQLNGYT